VKAVRQAVQARGETAQADAARSRNVTPQPDALRRREVLTSGAGLGNQAVLRRIALPGRAMRNGSSPPPLSHAAPALRRKCAACGGEEEEGLTGVIQPKLVIGAVDDPLEDEADRAADAVMRMADPVLSTAAPDISATGNNRLRRSCSACKADEDRQTLRAKEGAASGRGPGEAPPIVQDVLSSPGQALDPDNRSFLETRFGADFSKVRVHTDSRAAHSARAVNAQAYTVGTHVVFETQRYAPSTSEGRRLLAHELTHVLQQNQQTGASSAIGLPDGAAELTSIGYGQPGREFSPATRSLQRWCSWAGSWFFDYDGCSVPEWLQSLVQISDKDNPGGGADTQFSNLGHTGACDRHDECYQTCSGLGRKQDCDDQFLQDMQETCSQSAESSAVKADCMRFATMYSLGVALGGASAFLKDQKEVCSCFPQIVGDLGNTST
jgi:hypothetical protein